MSIAHLNRNSWFVVAPTKEIKQTYGFTLLGENYVAYRYQNQLFVTDDHCPHRHYPLSKGKMTDAGLECPYHGWCFATEGTTIPGKEEISPIKLKQYPTTLINDHLFFYPEFKTSATPFDFPVLKNRQGSITMNLKIKAPAYLLIENTLDPFHTPFVHAGLVRGVGKRKTVDVEIKAQTQSVEAIYLNEGTQSGIISKLFGSQQDQGIGRYVHPSWHCATRI